MERPTPVSALIHAATMVTAGVYLIARTSPLFELAVDIQELAGILGAVTLLLAGLVALVQTDIKRVIAYSTMSQIGYMFVGVGLGAYGAGLFHLMTHAFFTAVYTFRLLFVVFWGEPSPFVREHLHPERFEGGVAMAWPVAVLTVLATVGGLLQVPGAWNAVDDWLHPVAESIEEAGGGTAIFSGVAALVLSLAGIALAWALYTRPGERPARLRRRLPHTASILEHKAYVDEAYDVVFYEPSSRLAAGLTRFAEEPLFLRSLGGLGSGVRDLSGRVAAAQTGRVRSYVLAVAGGLA